MCHTGCIPQDKRLRQHFLKNIRSFSVANLTCSVTRSQPVRVHCGMSPEPVPSHHLSDSQKLHPAIAFTQTSHPEKCPVREPARLPLPYASILPPLCPLSSVRHQQGWVFLHKVCHHFQEYARERVFELSWPTFSLLIDFQAISISRHLTSDAPVPLKGDSRQLPVFLYYNMRSFPSRSCVLESI